jgi:hypothetical protein
MKIALQSSIIVSIGTIKPINRSYKSSLEGF